MDNGASATNVVHRLNVIASTPTGLVGYTSGDTNVIADPQAVSLQGEMPVVKLGVPFAGVFYEMSSKTIFLVVIGLVFLLLVSTRSSSNTGGSTRAPETSAPRPFAV
ncbi:MAG: hypothetical protein IH960_09295 [Chloroflexi bacterium]|nr:hypothetical protein [Chloroflexota bacterium]